MRNIFKKLFAVAFGVVFALVLLEIACQLFFALAVKPKLTALQNDPFHYYQPSADPVLVYELKPGYRIEKGNRRIAIDDTGLRDDGDHKDAPHKVALLGDSVPFGTALSQEDTPPAALQALTGDSVKVLNFGTPGYGLEEIRRYFEVKCPAYQPDDVYYLLNINDFSKRNTVYEGGDNGLYRIYHRPFLKMPFFIRKAIYRFVKEGRMSSVRWYRWLYTGNSADVGMIKDMAATAAANGCRFTVVLLPPAVAYQNGGFALQPVFDEIGQYLDKNGIAHLAPVTDFSQNIYSLQDNTDHFTPAGSRKMSEVIFENLREK
jgi:hypothetical protein